jgi:glutamine synthetase
VPSTEVGEGFFTDGKMFDRYSNAGWKHIKETDMILMPDPSKAREDIFIKDSTLILH